MQIPGQLIEARSERISGLFVGLSRLNFRMGTHALTLFLSRVPEKGDALWRRFQEWRDANGGGSFCDFALSVFTTEEVKRIAIFKQ